MQAQNQRGNISRSTIVFLLVLTAITAWFVINRQFVIDTVRQMQYVPAEPVRALENNLLLTDMGKKLFAASQPKLEAAEAFNTNCNQKTETNNPILGCYVGQSIYIFDVTNNKLAGIEQTTAAHELLHAVYERLPGDQKAAINEALQKAYEAHKTPDLEKRMEFYRQSEPGEETNELHSILGTEFDNLGDVLEAHYQKYFTKRASIVAFNKQYNDVFTSIATRLRTLTDTINASVESINERIRQHNISVKQLEADQQAFVAKNRRSGFSTIAEFNSAQQSLNLRANQLNAERDQIAADIASSDALRDEYNTLTSEYNELNQSMNSSLAPKPSL